MNILMAEHTHFKSLFQVGCQHIARGLAMKGHRITYISLCLTPFAVVNFFDKKPFEKAKRIVNYLKRGEQEAERIFSYVPFTFLPLIRHPLFDNDWVARRFLRYTVPRLSSFCNRNGPFDAVLIGDPSFVPLISDVDCDQVILRLTDNLTAFPQVPRVYEKLIEEGLCLCDKVVVTSEPLLKLFARPLSSKSIHYVPNGVDFEHFSRDDRPEPYDIKHIGHPRVVYVGAIDNWFDVGLLETVAIYLQDVSFVIIGPPVVDLSRLESLPNVHILGPRPYATIPGYLVHSDVGIIPFKRNRLTDYVSPIKLYEYMACGLPVVASEWKELKAIGSPAHMARNEDHFIQLLVEVLENPRDSEKYRAFAKENSWAKRIDDIEKIIHA